MVWSKDIEFILDKIRINSILLSDEHKNRFFYLKEKLMYYRLPVIVISGISSIVSVGLQNYVDQKYISITTCVLSLACSIIGSIELYLAIQTQMENELTSLKDYYLLSIDIYKMLKLDVANRDPDGKAYLEEKYSEYCTFIKSSNIMASQINDRLSVISLLDIEKLCSHSKKNKHCHNIMDDNISLNVQDLGCSSPKNHITDTSFDNIL